MLAKDGLSLGAIYADLFIVAFVYRPSLFLGALKKPIALKTARLLFVITLLASFSACAKKENEPAGSPFEGGNRVSFRYSGESFNDAVNRFDQSVENGSLLFTEEVTNLRSVDANQYNRTDIARMQKGQTARIMLPSEVSCLQGSFSISHPPRPAGGVFANLSALASNQTCAIRLQLDINPTPVQEEYGRIVFTGQVRHQNVQKAATYTVIIKDSNDLGGRTNGSTTPGSQGAPAGSLQRFISIGDGLNLGDSTGQIEVFQYQGQDGTPLNALVFPLNTVQSLIEMTVNLPLPLSDALGTWRYKNEMPIARRCWIVHTSSLSSNLSSSVQDYNLMPLPEQPRPTEWTEGDPLCPITIPNPSIDTANATARIKLETEPLPGFEARHTVRYLGRYGSFLEGPRNYVGYELQMKIEKVNSSGQVIDTKDQVNTFTFNINVRQMRNPTSVAAHRFMGVFENKGYFLIQARMTQVRAEEQAALIKSLYNFADAYLVQVDSAAEQNFLNSKYTELNVPGRVWMGLSDRQQEGQYLWHRLLGDRPVWNPSSNYNNSNFNNDGNEDCIHMRYDENRWNDTECYKTYVSVVEVPSDGTLADFR
jgi:hypothetical protein